MLAVKNLCCEYGSAKVLQGVDLDVRQGESVCILGRNGLGKTSLLRCLFGFKEPRVSAGEITFSGNDLLKLDSHEIARLGIGLVPQGRMIFQSLTVEENLRTTARRHGESSWTLDKVYEFFPILRERASNRGSDLSGGEQQMLAIGRSLMTNPDLLVMDEASEGLAPAVILEIRDRLLLLKEDGLTVLFTEQNFGFASSLADRFYILGEGGVVGWHGLASDFDVNGQDSRRLLGV